MPQNYVTFSEFRHSGECVAFELENGYNRGDITIDPALVTSDVAFETAVIQDGTILGLETTSGNGGPVSLTATDGTQNVGGVSIEVYGPGPFIERSTVTAIVRGPARLFASRLQYPAGATAAQIAAINLQIQNLPGGIVLI